MIPLVDTHCHVLAGLDDGARDDDEALRMCEMAYRDGVHVIAATAHQSAQYAANDAATIANATERLARLLAAESLPIAVFPCGEVALADSTIDDFRAGRLQSIGVERSNVLVEYPIRYPGDFAQAAHALLVAGIRPIIAHAERYSNLLDNAELVADLVRLGCLVQVSVAALDCDSKGRVQRIVRQWIKGGLVHLVGSDAHDSFRRRPLMASAYAAIARWSDEKTADRICGIQSLALLRGRRIRVEMPKRRGRWRGLLRRWLGPRQRPIGFSIPDFSKAK